MIIETKAIIVLLIGGCLFYIADKIDNHRRKKKGLPSIEEELAKITKPYKY